MSTLLNVFHAHAPVIVYLFIIFAWSLYDISSVCRPRQYVYYVTGAALHSNRLYADYYKYWSVQLCNNTVIVVLIVVINYNKIGGQFNERLLLWQPSGIFFYSTVIILICFMLCWRTKYDDDVLEGWYWLLFALVGLLKMNSSIAFQFTTNKKSTYNAKRKKTRLHYKTVNLFTSSAIWQ